MIETTEQLMTITVPRWLVIMIFAFWSTTIFLDLVKIHYQRKIKKLKEDINQATEKLIEKEKR